MSVGSFLEGIHFTNKITVFQILLDEGIDDLSTLRAASEDDLRKAGIKMGDIIKLRKRLEEDCLGLNSSFDSGVEGSNYDEDRSFERELLSSGEDIKTQPSIQLDECGYTAQQMLEKCTSKRTDAQIYYRNLLRDCARQARIWQKSYSLPSIPDAKYKEFMTLITEAAPQLANHKSNIRLSLGQALQNKRKYERDVDSGKRTLKKRKSNKENKLSSAQFQKVDETITVESPPTETIDVKNLPFKQGEDVNVYHKKILIAKAIYIGPNESSDANDMYSLLQLKKTLLTKDDDEVPLPVQTTEGSTTINDLMVNTIFVWKTIFIKVGSIIEAVAAPAKKKAKLSSSKEKPSEHSTTKYDEAVDDTVKGHDGGILLYGKWVAVAYNQDFYVGQVMALRVDKKTVKVNFLQETKPGVFIFPKPRDVDTVSAKYVFCSCPLVAKLDVSSCNWEITNFDFLSKQYEKYQGRFMCV